MQCAQWHKYKTIPSFCLYFQKEYHYFSIIWSIFCFICLLAIFRGFFRWWQIETWTLSQISLNSKSTSCLLAFCCLSCPFLFYLLSLINHCCWQSSAIKSNYILNYIVLLCHYYNFYSLLHVCWNLGQFNIDFLPALWTYMYIMYIYFLLLLLTRILYPFFEIRLWFIAM